MRILSFEIHGLHGRPGVIGGELKPDINILTGKNGAGKTSVLKLLWYVMSGNILLAINEVLFVKLRLTTDLYECTVYRISRQTCRVELQIGGKTLTFDDIVDDDDDVIVNAEDEANPLLMEQGQSVFLPTFRRIEGGFTMSTSRPRPQMSLGLLGARTTSSQRSDIENSLTALARKLTNGAHTFVTSISTLDIVQILLTRYADLSNEYTEYQQSTSQEIISRIKDFRADEEDSGEVDKANSVLDGIRSQIESMERRREEIMTPIEAVRSLVQRLFNQTGITIGARLSFGDAANAVNSDALSAGEKQMLSFICYNAFNQNSVVFIDEPELSLHVDWQRQLFPILEGQRSSNQFIVATHSPFIYSKYPDKEIQVGADRGFQSDE